MYQFRRAKAFLAAVIVSHALAGCASVLHTNSITDASTGTADRLADQMQGSLGRPGGRVVVTSLVPVTNLTVSTPFGQATAEQISARLAQRGYDVVEIRLMNAIGVNERGEFALSRDATAIAKGHNAAAIVTGTYAIGADTIYVTVRSVAVDNSSVLAAQTYTLPLTPDIKAMIDVRATPPAWRAAVSYGHEGVIGAADPGLGYVHVLQAQAPPSPTGPTPLAGKVSGQGVAVQIATLPPEQRKMVQDACAARRSGVAGPLGSPVAVIVEPLTQIDLSTACSFIR